MRIAVLAQRNGVDHGEGELARDRGSIFETAAFQLRGPALSVELL
jgi:hypothetical protein